MLEKAFCSNIAPSLSSGNHLFYKAEYMGRIYIYGSLETILNKPFSLVHPTPGLVVHHSPDLPHLCRDVLGHHPCWYSS